VPAENATQTVNADSFHGFTADGGPALGGPGAGQGTGQAARLVKRAGTVSLVARRSGSGISSTLMMSAHPRGRRLGHDKGNMTRATVIACLPRTEVFSAPAA
jgi:hypothetical protein